MKNVWILLPLMDTDQTLVSKMGELTQISKSELILDYSNVSEFQFQ